MTCSSDPAPAGADWAAHVAVQPSAAQPERFSFTGSGSEYFRIWIVNLLLTVATLGIYSAQAKVRKMRYFYNSTRIAGASFDYHGNPKAILKGRMIAFACLAGYKMAAHYSESPAKIVLAALVLAMPWVIWKSLQFKLVNSSYRGIHFGFRGSAGQAYMAYLLPVIAALSLLAGFSLFNFESSRPDFQALGIALGIAICGLLLLAPFAHQRMKRFQHEESRFGATHFSFYATIGDFYKVYLIGYLVAIAGFIIIAMGIVLLLFIHNQPGESGKYGPWVGLMAISLILPAAYIWLHSLIPLFLTMLQNLIWNNTRLGEHRFSSDMKWSRITYIAFTNLIGIVLTMGLFTPFARIRTMKYRIESLSLIPQGSTDDFIQAVQKQASATGEGMVDLFDLDVSL